MSERHLVVYGDFNCPWSYVAFRRSELLAARGIGVDWRAVEHDPFRPGRPRAGRFDGLRAEVDRMLPSLLPGERLPYSLAGFVPYTRAAISGYAGAYGAGVCDQAVRILFDAFWLNGIDIGNPQLVRTLLVDAIRSGRSTSDPLREWGYAVTVNGSPVTTTAHRLIRSWQEEWVATGRQVVPTLTVDGGRTYFGEDAVAWLGDELALLGLDLDAEPPRELPRQRLQPDRAHPSWASTVGGRWVRPFQDSARPAG